MHAKRGRAARPPTAKPPDLPVWKAFVVQFSRDTTGRAGPCSGRVEHMSSGRRARFESMQELTSVLKTLLAKLGTEEAG